MVVIFDYFLNYLIHFSDPPLEEDDIPIGEWVCHQCKVGGVSSL